MKKSSELLEILAQMWCITHMYNCFNMQWSNRVTGDSREIFCSVCTCVKVHKFIRSKIWAACVGAVCVRLGCVQLWSAYVKCVLIEGREYI